MFMTTLSFEGFRFFIKRNSSTTPSLSNCLTQGFLAIYPVLHLVSGPRAVSHIPDCWAQLS